MTDEKMKEIARKHCQAEISSVSELTVIAAIAEAVALENERCVKAIQKLAGPVRLGSTWPTAEMCIEAIRQFDKEG